MLSPDSRDSFFKRKNRGDLLITTAWSREVTGPEDREAAATDGISDILTALFGRAGDWSARDESGVGIIHYNAMAISNAAALLNRALESYKGDAEDYFDEPPGRKGGLP